MPIISRFYGITIKIYFIQKEHNPPHIHALYGDYACAISIIDGSVLDGNIPNRALELVREWIIKNKQALLKIWNTQEFVKIPPLE